MIFAIAKLFGAAHTKNRKNNIKNILIVRNDKIGDMILSSLVFREISKNFPNAKTTIIASPANYPIVEKNKRIQKKIILKSTPRSFTEFYRYLKLSKQLKKEKYDVGIDLRGSLFNAFFLLFLPKIKYRVGFYEQSLSRHLLNYAYRRDKSKHETFLILDLINKSLNLKSKDYWPEICYDSADNNEAKEILDKNKLKRFICLCVDASSEKKQISLDIFDEVIKYLNKKYKDYKVALVGTDENKIDWLLEKNPGAIKLKDVNLRVLYLLFKKSKLVIAPDGGPMHLAWSSKSPLLAIMPGHLLIDHIKPLSKNNLFIMGDVKEISSKEIIDKIDLLLGRG